MQALKKDDSFSPDPQKTYSLMAVVEGETFQVEKGPDHTVLSWPHLMVRELVVFLVVAVVILGISLVFNAPLEEAANPVHSTNPAKAPWYFVGIQELVSYSAFLGGIVTPAVIVIALFLLPYLDRNPKGTGTWFSRDRLLANLVFTLFVAAMIALIVIGQFLRGPNWTLHLPWH